MKLIMAIIKPFKLDEVREAADTALGVQGHDGDGGQRATDDRRGIPRFIAARNTHVSFPAQAEDRSGVVKSRDGGSR